MSLVSHGAVSQQSKLWSISDQAVAHFNEDDWKLLRVAATTAMKDETGDVQEWENPRTGNNGKVKALQSFQSDDGRPCRRMQFFNHAKVDPKPIERTSSISVCQSPDGRWLMDAEARPPK